MSIAGSISFWRGLPKLMGYASLVAYPGDMAVSVRPKPGQFGKWLRGARTAAGMTQHELAQRCSVRKQAVSAWENGKQYPTAARLHTLEQLFGQSGGLPEPHVAEQAAVYGDRSSLVNLSPDEVRIVGIYRWLVRQSEGGK